MWDDNENNGESEDDKIIVHNVKEGDTLMDILKMHNMSCEDLLELNSKNGIYLKPDTVIYVEKDV